MRCPKCSYISFDLVESCTKCGKDISKAAEELRGTIADVEIPTFLKLEFEEYDSDAVEETAGGEDGMLDLGVEEDEEAFDFALEDEGEAEDDSVDFAIEEDAAPEAGVDFDIGLDEEPEELQQEEAIDISDLSPAEEVADEPLEAVEEFQLETEEAFEEAASEAKELADLEVDGIDLEGSSAPKSGKAMPSVKTGTALDDFDIDLGDLLTGKKEGGE